MDQGDSLARLRETLNGDTPARVGAAVSALPNVQQPEPEGFDAGDVWVFPYTLKPYVSAEGHVPPPTQARIDRFQRNMAKLLIEYEKAARDAAEAETKAAQQKANAVDESSADESSADESSADESSADDAPEELDVEAALAEVDRALEEKNAAVGKIKDCVADLCNGHPTRNQLEKLPEYVFMRFAQVLGRKVNPEA